MQYLRYNMKIIKCENCLYYINSLSICNHPELTDNSSSIYNKRSKDFFCAAAEPIEKEKEKCAEWIEINDTPTIIYYQCSNCGFRSPIREERCYCCNSLMSNSEAFYE